ncbi:MAG: hypothetical protein AB7P31_01235 [Steroidobacteraceae bacterium]
MSTAMELKPKRPALDALTFEPCIGTADDPASLVYALCAVTRTLESIQLGHYEPPETRVCSEHNGLVFAAAILAERCG